MFHIDDIFRPLLGKLVVAITPKIRLSWQHTSKQPSI